ncbi:MAG: hypothetical protein ACRDRP_22945 [Pseudonocardiaceae bacterium]
MDGGEPAVRFVQTPDLDAGHAELLALKAALGEAESSRTRVFLGKIEAHDCE